MNGPRLGSRRPSPLNRPAFLLAFFVVAILSILGLFMPAPWRDAVSARSDQLFSPLWRAVGWTKQKSGAFIGDVRTLEQLQDDLAGLRAENMRLATDNQSLRGVLEENQRLKEMLGFKQASRYRLLPCRVIDRDPSSWWNSLIVDRGSSDEPALRENLPVLSPRGVVGKTGTVSAYTTRILLLVDDNCKISAVTETSRGRGIVIGATTSNGGVPACRITFLPRDCALSVGERVFTSGLGGTFPANLLLGVISDAPPLNPDRNFGLYRDGTLTPTVDLNQTQEVFILLEEK